jgi:hypothetical protein
LVADADDAGEVFDESKLAGGKIGIRARESKGAEDVGDVEVDDEVGGGGGDG